ncbi:hypothetical protein Z043_119838 [Scleropages formosus]|uniref:XK-related protein n=1 Tax=Scleropages formosus TaxID=113540 RepID=A0A0P7Y8N0_SCLFO|nr:hypothetical protein Z043_119838 [Scleropages formosus]
MWQGVRVCCGEARGAEALTYMTHDLSMLRLIETFCESVPQLTLVLYIVLRTNQADLLQGEYRGHALRRRWVCVGLWNPALFALPSAAGLSLAASTISIAWMVVDYHRSLRSFLPEKATQGLGSSAVYFAWNLLLIGARMCCLAMFACALPHCFPLHFLLLWSALVLWARLQRTTFMDSTGGEWLYRAMVGLVWYFSWFNVAEGRTRCRALIYHSFMAVDSVIVVSTWWCLSESEEMQLYAPWLVSALIVSNLLGLLLKLLYYHSFHPTLALPPAAGEDAPDNQVSFRSFSVQASYLWRRQNKRMAYHASCFYVPEHPPPEKRNISVSWGGGTYELSKLEEGMQ